MLLDKYICKIKIFLCVLLTPVITCVHSQTNWFDDVISQSTENISEEFSNKLNKWKLNKLSLKEKTDTVRNITKIVEAAKLAELISCIKEKDLDPFDPLFVSLAIESSQDRKAVFLPFLENNESVSEYKEIMDMVKKACIYIKDDSDLLTAIAITFGTISGFTIDSLLGKEKNVYISSLKDSVLPESDYGRIIGKYPSMKDSEARFLESFILSKIFSGSYEGCRYLSGHSMNLHSYNANPISVGQRKIALMNIFATLSLIVAQYFGDGVYVDLLTKATIESSGLQFSNSIDSSARVAKKIFGSKYGKKIANKESINVEKVLSYLSKKGSTECLNRLVKYFLQAVSGCSDKCEEFEIDINKESGSIKAVCSCSKNNISTAEKIKINASADSPVITKRNEEIFYKAITTIFFHILENMEYFIGKVKISALSNRSIDSIVDATDNTIKKCIEDVSGIAGFRIKKDYIDNEIFSKIFGMVEEKSKNIKSFLIPISDLWIETKENKHHMLKPYEESLLRPPFSAIKEHRRTHSKMTSRDMINAGAANISSLIPQSVMNKYISSFLIAFSAYGFKTLFYGLDVDHDLLSKSIKDGVKLRKTGTSNKEKSLDEIRRSWEHFFINDNQKTPAEFIIFGGAFLSSKYNDAIISKK